MRLTTVFLMASLMQVSAAGFAQKISLSESNVSLKTILKALNTQTGYDFIYTEKILKNSSPVSINVKNADLPDVLTQIFNEQPLTYSIDSKTVIIKAREKPFFENLAHQFRVIDLQGKVIDNKGNPLPGASIKVKSTGRAAVTNSDGLFEIKGVDPDGTVLIISYIGYKVKEFPLSNSKFITIVLEELSADLETVNVVSTGYQTLSKERATGAFDQVGQDILSRRPVANVSTALQGMVAGMQSKENADGSVSFLIRGNSSLYANRDPLVVVDGFPLANSDFSTINPNDIESISVLKDAAAASIWGARAANGVIVVVTKKSNLGGGLTINASTFTRVSSLTDLDQLFATASSADHVAYEKLAFNNGWFTNQYAGSFPGSLRQSLTLVQELLFANKNGKISSETMNFKLDSLSSINNHGQISDLLLRRAILSQYNVNFSQGSDRSKTYASLLFEDNKTRYQGSGYKKYGMNFNNEYKLSNFLTFNFGLNLQYKKEETSGATISELAELSPYETLLNPDGSYAVNLKDLNGLNREMSASLPLNSFPYSDWSYNLLRETRGRKLSSEDYNARIQTGFNVKLLPGLTFDTKVQYERGKTEYDNYYSDDTYYVRNMVNNYIDYNNTTRTVNKVYLPKGGIGRGGPLLNRDIPDVFVNAVNTTSYVFRNQLNFNRGFGTKHSINAIAGMEVSQYRTDKRVNPWLYGYYPEKLQSTVPVYGYGSSVEQFVNVTGNPATLNGGITVMNYTLNRYVSYYSNIAYTYDQKYTISGSIRGDASNFITSISSLRWSPLWSVGGLWNIKREPFATEIDFIDRLRLRATYGRNGNVEQTTSTNTLLSVSTVPSVNTGTITATIADNGNPSLRWETTTTTNIGLDFALFRGKLIGKLDWYNKIGTDITGLVTLAAATGTTRQKFNNAGITNRGIEIELGTRLKIPGIPVFYNSSFNYAYNKNSVNKLYSPSLSAQAMLDIFNANVEGRPVNPVYSYTYLGTIAGVPQVAGPNGLPTTMNSASLFLNGVGSQFLNYEGTATPPHTLGWNNSFSYSGFNLSVLFIGKFGGVYRNPTFNYSSADVGSDKTVINRYVADVLAGRTDIPAFPKSNETLQYLWDRYTPYLSGLVESSSYVECKEITLDYTLPKSLMDKVKIRNIKFFAQARDIGIIWAANKKGYNPDWLPGTDRPMGTYTLGINVGL